MATGRPTDYRKEYCEIAIEYMKDGKHAIQLARHLGIAKSTLYKWAEEIPEFSDALNAARTSSTAAWLDRYQEKAFGITKEGSDYLLAKMLAHKDREFQEQKEEKKEESKEESILKKCSTETLTAVMRDLSKGE